MKIFNWMHKRFHHNTLKDGFASNMKKTEPTINNVDSQALLKQVALNDLLGGWKDGILTIGTFGYDHHPLKSNTNHHNEYFALETEQHEGEGDRILVYDVDDGDRYNENCYYTDEHEELNPLMHNTFEHNFEDVANASKEIVIAQLPVISDHEIMESNNAETDEKKKKKKGERITLADLFLADSDVKMKLQYPAKVLVESSEKQSLKAKHGLSFAKKLIPRVKDHPHPMRDIKKLMKKSLKRKIHPDLDVKNQQPEGQEVTAAGIVDYNHKNESNDSTYFLPI